MGSLYGGNPFGTTYSSSPWGATVAPAVGTAPSDSFFTPKMQSWVEFFYLVQAAFSLWLLVIFGQQDLWGLQGPPATESRRAKTFVLWLFVFLGVLYSLWSAYAMRQGNNWTGPQKDVWGPQLLWLIFHIVLLGILCTFWQSYNLWVNNSAWCSINSTVINSTVMNAGTNGASSGSDGLGVQPNLWQADSYQARLNDQAMLGSNSQVNNNPAVLGSNKQNPSQNVVQCTTGLINLWQRPDKPVRAIGPMSLPTAFLFCVIVLTFTWSFITLSLVYSAYQCKVGGKL